MKCPVCRTDNPPDSKFCKECATPLPTSRLSPPLVTETLETVREELTTGTLFAGRYQIIEELGHGGWAGSIAPWIKSSTKKSP